MFNFINSPTSDSRLLASSISLMPNVSLPGGYGNLVKFTDLTENVLLCPAIEFDWY